MKELRRNFERFCYRNRNKGIPSLMLYISLGNAIVYLISQSTGSFVLYNLLCFHRGAILGGQVWRLITYPLTMYQNNVLFMLLMLLCYYTLGQAMERIWGTCKFNLFYFTGVILMDIYGMIFGCQADVYYLNMSLFLGYATLFPQAGFLFMFIIPVKAWVFALIDLAIVLMGVFQMPFTAYNIFPLIALANYFLFFGDEVGNVFPLSFRNWLRKLFKKKPKAQPKVITFHVNTGEVKPAQPAYRHKCTVCGRTDVTNPELEFRYCSRCKGYYCYCEDHISAHAHIE